MAEEKIEKGVISEEALEEIAGGLNISKDTLKKVAIGAGVTVLGLAGLAGIGYVGKKLYDDSKDKALNEIKDEDTDLKDTINGESPITLWTNNNHNIKTPLFC